METGEIATRSQSTKLEMTTKITIRPESTEDTGPIERLTEAAFKHAEHSSHTEHFIINALRHAGQLSLSLVAVEGDRVVGHVAISPVTISSGAFGWYGLGPISVLPDRQAQGIGSMLVKVALTRLQALGGAGCVLLGDPSYYKRFGFMVVPGLELPGVAQGYFQAILFGAELPVGSVKFHSAFEATERPPEQPDS
jgi:predicted N-acetyltransferase YhbS